MTTRAYERADRVYNRPMESVKCTVARALLAMLVLAGATVADAREARSDRAGRAELYACRFEQPGRGDRLLLRPARDPAVEACLARTGFRPAHATSAR